MELCRMTTAASAYINGECVRTRSLVHVEAVLARRPALALLTAQGLYRCVCDWAREDFTSSYLVPFHERTSSIDLAPSRSATDSGSVEGKRVGVLWRWGIVVHGGSRVGDLAGRGMFIYYLSHRYFCGLSTNQMWTTHTCNTQYRLHDFQIYTQLCSGPVTWELHAMDWRPVCVNWLLIIASTTSNILKDKMVWFGVLPHMHTSDTNIIILLCPFTQLRRQVDKCLLSENSLG